jgi:cytochrome c biogenesis protein CcdA
LARVDARDVVTAQLSYAFALGLVAAVNPCGFPMLPAYLSFFMSRGDDSAGAFRRLAGAIKSAAAVSAGFVVVFAVLGAVFDAGLTAFMAWVPWVMLLIGTALLALGVAALLGRHLPLRLPHLPWTGRDRSVRSMVGFGVSYAVASLTCSLSIFLAGVAGAFTRVGPATGIATFLAYAAGMASVLGAVSVAMALAQASVVKILRQASRYLDRLGPGLLTVVGAYLVYYWASYLTGSSPAGLIGGVERLQGTLSSTLSQGDVELALGLGVGTLVLVLVWVGVARLGAANQPARLARLSARTAAPIGLAPQEASDQPQMGDATPGRYGYPDREDRPGPRQHAASLQQAAPQHAPRPARRLRT